MKPVKNKDPNCFRSCELAKIIDKTNFVPICHCAKECLACNYLFKCMGKKNETC